ncbi:methyl-accepting chemotaxis protein [Paenibacillus sp. GCM10027627]|uniref:methyl-accepting chemotaxis protein n=1 Tax=unclassified Paenibacillus TaxID=185978 RepID=UPI00362B5AE6
MNRLLTRMVLFFSCLIIAAVAVLGFTLYRSSMSLVENSLGAQAQLAAENAARLIDPVSYAQLKPEDGATEYYSELREKLNALREANGLKYLYTLAKGEENGNAYYYYMVDGAPADAAEGDFSPIGTREENEYPGMVQAFAEGEAHVGELSNDEEYGATITAYVPLIDDNGKMIGLIGADFDAATVYALMSNNTEKTVYIALGIVAAGILLVFLLASYLTNPLKRLTSHVAKVREGDMTVNIPVYRKDEIGHLALTFQQLVSNTRSVIRSMKESSEQLMEASEGVTEHAKSTTEASRDIAASIQEASGGARTQVSRAADMTKAMESMTGNMQRITESAAIVSDVAHETKQHSDRGHRLLHGATEEMEEIGRSAEEMLVATKELARRSDEIGEISTVMADIAEQTNLLALNAAIEAAHAGENGKGFAVVADQVRKLAAQSGAFAEKIAELVARTQEEASRLASGMENNSGKVRSGITVVKEASDAFHSIVGGLEQVSSQLQEVAAASQQVSAESEEVAASVEELELISRNAAQYFEGIAVSSSVQMVSMNEVSSSAELLKNMSNELNALNKRFIV